MRQSSFPPKLRKFVKSVEKNAQAAGHAKARARIYGAWAACFVRFCTVKDQSWRTPESVTPFLDYLGRRDDVDEASGEKAAESMVFLFENLLKTDVGDASWHPDRQEKSEPEASSETEGQTKEEEAGEQSSLLTRLVFHTSLPINEALELCAGDVDLESGLIYVSDPMGTPKRIVELPDTLHEPLQNHLDRIREEHGRQYFDAPLFQAQALQGRRETLDQGGASSENGTETSETESEPVATEETDETGDADRPASLWGYAESD